MPDQSQQCFNDKTALKILSLSAAVYVVLFYTLCCLKYYGFVYDDFDLAIHDQIIWNILHGRIFNSILGVDFLGNHAHFISFLVAPIYWLVPHPLFLLFIQTFFLAIGVYPLFALARLFLDSEVSLIICLVYLLYPGLGFTNLYEFHPTCFAPFLLLCTAYYFYKENFFWFNVFMFLSLICQENISLIFVMWGVYSLFLRRPWGWVWWPSLVGLAYFLGCVYIVLPNFNKGVFNFFQIYGPLGSSLADVLKNCVLQPGFVLSIIFQPHKILYLVELFWGVALVPLLSPLALVPAFLVFLQHLLSFRSNELSLHYHYTAELIPFIFIAFIFGVKKIIVYEAKNKILRYALLLNAVVVSVLIGPGMDILPLWKNLSADTTLQKEKLIEEIPPDASVVATFEFLPHLSHRQNLYSFHHIYSGYFTLFSRRYELPEGLQYALIDFNDHLTFKGFYDPTNYQNMVSFFKQGTWGVDDTEDDMVLFQKGIGDRYPLFKFINNSVQPSHPLNLIIDDRIKFEGYNLRKLAHRVDIIFYWKLLQPEPRDVNLFMDLMDKNGRRIGRQFRPICYRIWPTQAWKPGLVVEDHEYVTITPSLANHLAKLKVGFFDYSTNEMLSLSAKGNDNSIEINLVN